MKVVFVLAACGAGGCGHRGFDSPPALVASYTADGNGTATSVPATLQVGDVAVIAVAQESAVSPLAAVTDTLGNTYTSAGARAVSPMAGPSCEIWYATVTSGGSGVVTASNNNQATTSLWVLDFSGLADGTPSDVAETSAVVTTLAAANPVTTTSENQLVVSILGVSTGGARPDGITNGNPFTPIVDLDLGATAYAVAATPGAYGAAWDLPGAGANACASTAAFVPATE